LGAISLDASINRFDGVTVLFVVNVDWFFLSHRLPLAMAVAAEGARVVVVATDTGQAAEVRAQGMDFFHVEMGRGRRNPLGDLRILFELVRLYRRLDPDIIHHVTIKPVVYGTLAARVAKPRTAVLNAITGLGFSFSAAANNRPLAQIVRLLYRAALRHPRQVTVFQNPEDRATFIANGLVSDSHTALIRSSGVDCERFAPGPKSWPPIVVLASRLLWQKGVGVFADAAAIAKGFQPSARFVLVGTPDEANPDAVPVKCLRRWHDAGVIEWWGFRSDMAAIMRQASVVVLPTTYPEGVPKVLLEGAACAVPLVATDVPGCREVVIPNRTGALVPPHDPPALAAAIVDLLTNPDRAARLGQSGRELVLSEFSTQRVVEQTIDLYSGMLWDSEYW
jgi:glycosyltransferase involved in cell wall biosynthesis